MVKTTTVLIVDDHPAIAVGTKAIIEQLEHVQVVDIAHNGASCLVMLREYKPDILILDFQLPDMDAIDVLRQLPETGSSPAVLIFTGIDYLPYYNTFLKLGVSGIMDKNATDDHLRLMLCCIMQGHTMLPIEMYRRLRVDSALAQASELNDEERFIMTLVVKGATNEQIAQEIHMSRRSVDNYFKRIYGKLGVGTRAQAIERFVGMKGT